MGPQSRGRMFVLFLNEEQINVYTYCIGERAHEVLTSYWSPKTTHLGHEVEVMIFVLAAEICRILIHFQCHTDQVFCTYFCVMVT